MNNEVVIQIENLTKEFESVNALTDVTLNLHAGSIIGLVGANGAGKSTLIRHMVGMYLPDAGTCRTLGCEAALLGPAELARIGYVHQEGKLVDWMTVEQMIRYVASFYPTWNKDCEQSYIDEFKLELDAIVGDLSPGQRQKLAILLAIGHEPELLLLDEPAAALDPIARQHFLDMLLGIIQDEGRTILISSHILSDIEKVIDHIVILDEGRVCRDVDMDEFRQQFVKARFTSLQGELPNPLPLGEVLRFERSGSEAIVVMRTYPEQRLDQIAESMDSVVSELPLSLEELYALVLECPQNGAPQEFAR